MKVKKNILLSIIFITVYIFSCSTVFAENGLFPDLTITPAEAGIPAGQYNGKPEWVLGGMTNSARFFEEIVDQTNGYKVRMNIQLAEDKLGKKDPMAYMKQTAATIRNDKTAGGTNDKANFSEESGAYGEKYLFHYKMHTHGYPFNYPPGIDPNVTIYYNFYEEYYYGVIGKYYISITYTYCTGYKIGSDGKPLEYEMAPFVPSGLQGIPKLIEKATGKSTSNGGAASDGSSNKNGGNNKGTNNKGTKRISEKDLQAIDLTPEQVATGVGVSTIILTIWNFLNNILSLKPQQLTNNLGGGAPKRGMRDGNGRVFTSRGWVDLNEIKGKLSNLKGKLAKEEAELARELAKGNTTKAGILKEDIELIKLKLNGYKDTLLSVDRALQEFEEEKELLRESIKNKENKAASDKKISDWADRAYYGANVVKIGADVSLGVLANSSGPVGKIINNTYTFLSGVAGGLGEGIADGGNFGQHLKEGAIQGTFDLAVNNTLDLAFGGAGKSSIGSSASKFTGELSGELKAMKEAFDSAVKSGDADAIRELYKRNGAVQTLGKLEELGAIPKEAKEKVLNVISNDIKHSTNQSMRDTIESLNGNNSDELFGIKIKEVVVGDSGSSANALKERAMKTDFDQTLVIRLDENGVKNFAKENNITYNDAYQKLTDKVTKKYHENLSSTFTKRTNGVSLDSVDAKPYNNIAMDTKQTDIYPEGYIRTRSAVEGKAEVFSFNKNGKLVSHSANGQTIVDAADLNKLRLSSESGENLGKAFTEPNINLDDLEGILQQQLKAIAKNSADPMAKDAAKALGRVQYVAGRVKMGIDPNLVEVAKQINKNPSKTAEILQSAGMSVAGFTTKTNEIVKDFAEQFKGFR